jgi:hypothetical protein
MEADVILLVAGESVRVVDNTAKFPADKFLRELKKLGIPTEREQFSYCG